MTTTEPSTWHSNFIITHVKKVRVEVTIDRDAAIQILANADIEWNSLDHLEGLDDDELLHALRDCYEESDDVYNAVQELIPPTSGVEEEQLENYVKIIKSEDY